VNSTSLFIGLGLSAVLLVGTAHGQDAPETEHQHHAEQQPRNDASEQTMPTDSEREHVPPDPPATELHAMPYRAMTRMMGMDDTASLGKILLDRLDWRDAGGASLFAWDAQAWYGNDYNKLWLKTEGERSRGTTEGARAEALWDRIVSRWWNLQAGVRHDFGEGPSRDWVAVGVQGLAPYFFDIEATAYLGDSGRTAARFSAEYDLLFTQRLVLQPQFEMNLYGKDDPANRIGSGLSNVELALRLRYEVRREFAPYVGLVWTHRFGNTADFAQAAGEDTSDVQFLAGLRVWF